MPEKTVPNKAKPPLHSGAAQQDVPEDIVIEVGPEKKRYRVQEGFLTYYSEYFRKALNGPWKEAEDRVVRLLDVEPPVFNLFVEWLYTQQLPQSCHAYDSVTYQKGEVVGDDNDMLKIKLYVLADRLMVLSLRRALNRTIVNEFESDYPLLWRYQPIIYAYNNLRTTDPLLDLFVDRHYMAGAEECDGYDNWELMDDLPLDFLLRFYKRVGIGRNSGRGHAAGIFNMDFCSYHEHDSDADRILCDRKGKSCPKKALLRRPVDDE